MKKKIVNYSLTSLIVFSSILSWMLVDRAINVEGASIWIIPMVSFTLLLTIISLGVVIIKQKKLLFLALAGGILTSFFWVSSFRHIAVLIFSIGLVIWGVTIIQHNLEMSIRLNIPKAIHTGKGIIIIALSLVITSQYYGEIKKTNKINVIPKFEMGKAINYALPMIYPDLKNNQKTELTVDDFILKAVRPDKINVEEKSRFKVNQANKVDAKTKEFLLNEERNKLADIVGEPLTGKEKIDTVFSNMINRKINGFFSPNLKNKHLPFLSWIAGWVLFLTVLSLGSFIFYLAEYLSAFIFWIFIKVKLVKIVKIAVEKEIIQED